MSVHFLGDNNPDGITMGLGITEKISFYGVTPIAQRASANQASTKVSAVSTDFGATQVAWAVEVSNTLVALGIWKGAA